MKKKRENLLMVADSDHDANMLYVIRMFIPDRFIYFRLRGRSYAVLSDAEARALKPHVVHVDEKNRLVKLGNDAAEPVPGSEQKRGDFIAAK